MFNIFKDVKTEKPGNLDAPSETITINFKIMWAVMLAVGLSLYVYLLVVSIISSQSSSTQAISIVNQDNHKNDDSNWAIYRVQPPEKPKPSNATTYGKMIWPIMAGDPTSDKYTVESKFKAVRLEVSLLGVTGQTTGATASMRIRITVPPLMFNWSSIPPKPLYNNISCTFGSYVVVSTGARSAFSQYNDITVDYPFESGTILQYPFDKYVAEPSTICTMVENNRFGILNHYIAVDTTNSGFYRVHTSFEKARVVPVDLSEYPVFDSTKRLGYLNAILNAAPAKVKLVLFRTPINIVFPMVFICAMWIMVIAQTMAFMPFYLGFKKVDGYPIPLLAVTMLFALPGIRNTLPGAPPLGAIIDFAAYFWNIVVAIGNLFGLAILHFFYSHSREARVKAKKVLDDEDKKRVNKPLKTLTVNEVILLFRNTGRSHLEEVLRKHCVDGKILSVIRNKSDLDDIELSGLLAGNSRMKLMMIDLDGWATMGVEAEKLVSILEPESIALCDLEGTKA